MPESADLVRARAWRNMAVKLAETLRFYQHAPTPSCDHCKALTAYEALLLNDGSIAPRAEPRSS